MTDLELIHAVYAYYNDDQPFSYTVAGMLDTKIDVSSKWSNLKDAYLNGEFYPDDVRFMTSYMKNLKSYEVKFEKFDYFFKKDTVVGYDFIEATDEEDAKARAIFKHGDAIDIIYVLEDV